MSTHTRYVLVRGPIFKIKIEVKWFSKRKLRAITNKVIEVWEGRKGLKNYV